MANPQKRENRQLLLPGIIIIIAGVEFIIGIFVAQAYYPGYSITQNGLSDLGATCHTAIAFTPNSCLIYQTSATIFDAALCIIGFLFATSAVLSYPSLKNKLFSAAFALFGLGALVAGIFTEQSLIIHSVAALVQFVAGIIAVLRAHRLSLAKPRYFRPLSTLVGLVSLAALIVFPCHAVQQCWGNRENRGLSSHWVDDWLRNILG
ncbi:MAG TPA: DUF998 domain-containing protein [Candidatus Bathyarchaeia archaeon]|nr:DUF998 domain-containing protein [Candidatus Bathyarchaeia archaeon]